MQLIVNSYVTLNAKSDQKGYTNKIAIFMSPVSPVFHTEVTLSIGLKNISRVRASILYYLMSMF